jgi:hypothetical protein
MVVKGKSGGVAHTIPIDLLEFVMHFRHRLPTTNEIETLKQYYLTKENTLWYTS